jgi:hypothetical protein
MKNICLFQFVVIILFSSNAYSEKGDWHFGIGTGFLALNIDGDVGLDTIVGPSLSELDMDSSDVKDLAETAFGFTGFAEKNQWKINYAVSHLELEENTDSRIRLTGQRFTAVTNFVATGFDVNVEYQYPNTGWSTYLGIRQTEHEIEFDSNSPNLMISRDLDEDWVDAYLGVAYQMPIGKDKSWKTYIDLGGGDSEGSYTVYSAFSWNFAKSWVASFYGRYYAVEYENEKEGDANWYLYDSAEFGLGLGILFLW